MMEADRVGKVSSKSPHTPKSEDQQAMDCGQGATNGATAAHAP